jgi:archaellum biogenesis ATPase FlaH
LRIKKGPGKVTYEFFEGQLRQQYRLLGHSGFYTQGRCLDVNQNKIISQELLKTEEETIKWAASCNGKGNVFLGRNPRQSDGSVADFQCLSLDIDPIRPKGTAASDGQFQEALKAAQTVSKYFKHGVVCSSGNGSLVLFPLPQAVDKSAGERLGKVLEGEARRIISADGGLKDVVTVDATWDAARLVKCLGTISTKGDRALWRHARIIYDGQSKSENLAGFLGRLGGSGTPDKPLPSLEVERGTLDRSKADIALANRLKLQGFGPDDALKSLAAYSMRPERTDDHKRIIEKVYFGRAAGSNELRPGDGDVRPLQLWTPENGADEYNQRRAGGRGVSDLTTGIAVLDSITRGIPRNHILTIGARTDCGKTAFAIGAAYANCAKGKRVLYFSTENEYAEIWDRYFATATGISAYLIQDHDVSGLHKERLKAFSTDFSEKHQFAIYDGSRPTISDVRRSVEEYNPDLVIFDYFQHFEQKDARLLAEFVIQVHELVREKKIGCLMTAMAHDRWDLKTRKPIPISMGDIKDCHTIQDESRAVILLDWDRDAVVGDGAAAVKAVLAKNKGKRENLVLKLNRTIPRFEEDII